MIRTVLVWMILSAGLIGSCGEDDPPPTGRLEWDLTEQPTGEELGWGGANGVWTIEDVGEMSVQLVGHRLDEAHGVRRIYVNQSLFLPGDVGEIGIHYEPVTWSDARSFIMAMADPLELDVVAIERWSRHRRVDDSFESGIEQSHTTVITRKSGDPARPIVVEVNVFWWPDVLDQFDPRDE